jgi:hypothetical protein
MTGGKGNDVVGYDDVLASVVSLLESARRASARAVNAVMTATYWQIGRSIVEHEQGGADRASYGERLLAQLSADLTSRFGRGFSRQNLQNMRLFYLAWPDEGICQTLSGESADVQNDWGRLPALGKAESGELTSSGASPSFPLP